MAAKISTWQAPDSTGVEYYRGEPVHEEAGPGLIIFPSIFGITEELAGHADRFASAGVCVVVYNPFSRYEVKRGFEEHEVDKARARINRDDLPQMVTDFRGLLAAMKEWPACNGRVAGLGICLGGPPVFNAAADGLLDSAATWHGSRMSGVIDRAAEIQCPVLMDYGDADPIAPPEELKKVRAGCEVIRDCTIRVHPGAGHGFSHTGWKGYDGNVMAQALPDLEKMLASLTN